MKTIRISDKNWQRIQKWRLKLGVKTLDDVIEKIFNIIKASELKKEVKKYGNSSRRDN